MVAVKRETAIDMLDMISLVRKMKTQGYDRFCFKPIPKADRVDLRYWKSKSASRKKPSQ